MIRVITISGEYGSGGVDIADRVAEQLHWALFDSRIIQEISKQAGVEPHVALHCDERVDSLLHRFIRSMWHSGTDRGAAAPDTISAFDTDAMAAMTRRIIIQAASIGSCVIVGRGGQCLLQDRRDCLHVFTYAPHRNRVAWVRSRYPDSQDPAGLCARKDDERAAYIRRHFDCDWTDRHLYDLMLSSSMGQDRIASILVDAVRGTPEAHHA
jgi:cytidylate kinase